MRADSFGIFWQDEPQTRGARGEVNRPMPPIPDTGWTAPSDFPDLSSAPLLGIDCETYDPDLLEYGPGWARGRGHIVGVSVAVPDRSWYFPMRHTIEPESNLNPDNVLAWLRDTLCFKHQPKVGANLSYDCGWLRQEGVNVVGPLYDVQFAEALIHERAKVGLDHLANRYLGAGKVTSLLYQWCADFYGGNPDSAQRKNIWRAPPRLVGHYAEADALLPLEILRKQWLLLSQESLLDVFYMENGLIPLLIDMRFRGVRVDVAAAETLADRIDAEREKVQARLNAATGRTVDVYAADSIAKAFDAAGVSYDRTAKGKPSFRKAFLENCDHDIARDVVAIRRMAKLGGTFVRSYILDAHIDGRLYGQFHLLRSDDNGTRSGRLSSSDPNLQNIPIRDEELAPLIRGLFLPDDGHDRWRRYDYSQIEYRGLVHFAVGPGSDDARARYHNDPNTDYHDMTLDMLAPHAGWDISTPAGRKKHRRPIKNINFGLIYGMGVASLSGAVGVSVPEGKKLFKSYHKAVPFAKPTMDQAAKEASQQGYITTILGRRSRFDLWEPLAWEDRTDETGALPYDEAVHRYGHNITRAFTHKGLNRRLQGSAADIMKKAMLECYRAGVFDSTGVPALTVHDELDFSDPGGVDSAFDEMRHIMETALPLRIPVRADLEIGTNWGNAK